MTCWFAVPRHQANSASQQVEAVVDDDARVPAVGAVLALCASDASAQGAEQQLENEPVPESVEDLKLPGDDPFEEPERRRPSLERVGRPLERGLLAIPGVEEPTAQVHFRSHYLRRKRRDNERAEAWRVGGGLVDTGWIRDRVRLGAEFFFSQRIHGPSDRGGTLLLRPVQRSYHVFGQSYLKLHLFEDTTASIYRRTYDLPYMNRRDNRMTPIAFEGYTAQGVVREDDGDPRFEYIGGYISRIKERRIPSQIRRFTASPFEEPTPLHREASTVQIQISCDRTTRTPQGARVKVASMRPDSCCSCSSVEVATCAAASTRQTAKTSHQSVALRSPMRDGVFAMSS